MAMNKKIIVFWNETPPFSQRENGNNVFLRNTVTCLPYYTSVSSSKIHPRTGNEGLEGE
jgi:hypothetical protein